MADRPARAVVAGSFPAAALLPLRAFLGGTFVYAGIQKLSDPGFLHRGSRTYIGDQLRGFASHIGDACIGSISEVFDAEEPFIPRGCVAQAWSVAEVLRGWIKTAPQGKVP